MPRRYLSVRYLSVRYLSVRYLPVVLLLAVIAVIATPRSPVATVHAQTASSLAGAPLTHLGIVTGDLESVVEGYADLWGIAVPAIRTISFDLTNGSRAEARVAYVPLPNFYLELLQPVTESGPIHDHLQKFGLGVHHLGVGVDANIDVVRAELESKGGQWTAGAPGDEYAFVDFRHTPIGATIEIGPTERPSMPAPPTTQTGLFGSRPIGHVGLANTDADASREKYVEVFGMEAPEVRRYPPEGKFPFPPGHSWDTEAYVRTAMLSQAGIGIEMIESVGSPTPWTRHIDTQNGTSIMHIAVGRGNIPRDEWLRIGQEKGGKWTNGGADSFFAYLDWSDTLGLVIE